MDEKSISEELFFSSLSGNTNDVLMSSMTSSRGQREVNRSSGVIRKPSTAFSKSSGTWTRGPASPSKGMKKAANGNLNKKYFFVENFIKNYIRKEFHIFNEIIKDIW